MTATDKFSHAAPDLDAPVTGGAAVTTSDVNELTYVTRAIYVGGAGNVKVALASGDQVTFTGVPVGTTLPLRVRQVFATGTTATNIIALY